MVELIISLYLVPGYCGKAVFATIYKELGIELQGLAQLFGLAELKQAIARVSACHLNIANSTGRAVITGVVIDQQW